MIPMGRYLLGILSGGFCCAIALELVGKKSANGAMIRFLCSVFMMICVVSPLLEIRLGSFADLTDQIKQEAKFATQNGIHMANEEYRSVITQRTKAYILDKAASMGADMNVEVVLSDSDTAQPSSVTLRGRISPYAKGIISSWLESELGIKAEEQTWIATN